MNNFSSTFMVLVGCIVLIGCDNGYNTCTDDSCEANEENYQYLEEEPEVERMYFYICMKYNPLWEMTPNATVSYFHDVAAQYNDEDMEPVFRTLTNPLMPINGELCFWTVPEKPSRFYYGAWVDVTDENKQAPYRASIVTINTETSEVISSIPLQVGQVRDSYYHGFPIWDAAVPTI
ncbi:hypothetical protein A2482_02805 [Candidatus Falkowbacteria bacterium RIFOXYC2_FULL_48_21]|uniref:Uncharacterized protein n=1 Tax=Candidatus Falkowbacteria bacterium RIFOXYC2_FULL_48_21 TaxID=1798005 RepID=A0A1F5TFL4_9BACT|nr:MAG: hypothetical protein A2482_02805 [Candidatus Falkowbacteria bacterium RIFOXYC2_FULL_48_21]